MGTAIEIGRPMEILLVEDSLADIELTLEGFSQAKFANQVDVARDGEEAVRYLRRTEGHRGAPRPDLIILDLNLPKLSGQEVLAELKAAPGLRRIPVAILTTSTAEADVMRSYDLGANCYLTKPVTVDEFMRVVQSIEGFWFGVVRLPSTS